MRHVAILLNRILDLVLVEDLAAALCYPRDPVVDRQDMRRPVAVLPFTAGMSRASGVNSCLMQVRSLLPGPLTGSSTAFIRSGSVAVVGQGVV